MLGVIWHIPCEKVHELARIGRAAVFEHIFNIRAAAMLGKKVKPQHREPQGKWREPDPKQQRRDKDRESDSQRIARQKHTRLLFEHGVSPLWQVRGLGLAACVHQQEHDLVPPIGEAGEVVEKARPIVWLGQTRQLRILRGILGVFVVGEVKVTKPSEGLGNQERNEMTDGFIEALGGKGRFMRCFMLKREKKRERYALGQKQ